jgi:presenilin-like A22 family membrane protease
MQVAELREGYELWHPNREKSESKATKALVAFVLLVSAGLLVLITLGGWERLQGFDVGVVTIIWAALYVIFAFLVVARWNRGVLPLASALAVIMIIFAAVAAPGWFSRDKEGLDSPAIPEELLGLLTLLVIPVQLLLIAVAMVGFNQGWNIEEERPVGGGFQPGPDEEPPPRREERRELEGAT